MNYHIEYREDWKTCTLEDLTMLPGDNEADMEIIAVSDVNKIGVRLLKNRHGGLWTHETLPAAAIEAIHEAGKTYPMTRNTSMYAAQYVLQDVEAFRKFVDMDAAPGFADSIIAELVAHARGFTQEASCN